MIASIYLGGVEIKEVSKGIFIWYSRLIGSWGVRIMVSQDSLLPQQRVIIKTAELLQEGHSACFKDLSMGCRK